MRTMLYITLIALSLYIPVNAARGLYESRERAHPIKRVRPAKVVSYCNTESLPIEAALDCWLVEGEE